MTVQDNRGAAFLQCTLRFLCDATGFLQAAHEIAKGGTSHFEQLPNVDDLLRPR